MDTTDNNGFNGDGGQNGDVENGHPLKPTTPYSVLPEGERPVAIRKVTVIDGLYPTKRSRQIWEKYRLKLDRIKAERRPESGKQV